MKITVLIMLFGLLSLNSYAQDMKDLTSVKETVNRFVKAGDTHDVAALDKVLHDQYRVSMNQLFGSQELLVWDKATYLKMIKAKKIGGDPRTFEIVGVQLNGKNAIVNVIMESSKTRFNSFFMLVKNADGNWQLLSDFPTIES